MSGRLILACGLPGAGKTTLARELEETLGAVRLCPDEWMVHLHASTPATRTCHGARFAVSRDDLHTWATTQFEAPDEDELSTFDC